jgi:hypothetical protein
LSTFQTWVTSDVNGLTLQNEETKRATSDAT